MADPTGLVAAFAPGSATIYAQRGTVKGKATVKVLLTLLAITINPSSPNLPANTTQALTVTGTYNNSATKALTSGVTWTSSNTSVATVSSLGQLVAIAQGTATITASASPGGGVVKGTAFVTVNNAAIMSVAVTPAIKKLPNGSSQQFTATATFSDGTKHVLLPPVVTWSSSSPSVAAITSAGVATGAALGTTTITAQHVASGRSGTAKLTVTAATLVSVAVTPVNPTAIAGMTQPFAATGTYSDGTTLDITNQATWSVATTAVATNSSAGVATAVAPGSTTVTATDPKTKKAGTTTLTVSPAVLASIALSPSSLHLARWVRAPR